MRCRSLQTLGLRSAAVLLAAGLSGCFAFGSGQRDVDRTPIVNTGVGATILYPGQTPAMPGSLPPAQTPPSVNPLRTPGSGAPGDPNSGVGAGTRAAPPQPPAPARPGLPGASSPAPAAAGGAVSGRASGAASGAPSGGSITMIGGAQRDELSHVQYLEEPTWAKYVALPFLAVAAPFKWAAESLRGERQPGPDIPRATPSAPDVAHRPPPDYENLSLQGLERELAQREAQQAAATPSTAPTSAQRGEALGGAALHSAAPSIADELAALQRAAAGQSPRGQDPAPPVAVAAARPPQAPVAQPTQTAAPPATAHGIVDRNGDGRTDHWIYREGGEIVREVFDEDFEGRPDRTLLYDLDTHQVQRVEEDSDRDGATDSWIDYREGSVVRRRTDADGDGNVDSWSYYAAGRITRHEQDSTGDGFRDRVGIYRDGRLEREELDRDGNGRPDHTLYYDANEQLARDEEDSDGDGRVDIISHYESGRLARRELLDPSLIRAQGGGQATPRSNNVP